MAELPPTQTLTPSMDPHDSADQLIPSENPPPSSPADLNLPDKTQHPMWKTSLCSFFRRSHASCSHGELCRYAHGEDAPRPRPDNTWDPTSERAKKMARTNDEEKEEVEVGGMMTEALEEGGDDSSTGLSKCLVNLPMKWSSDNLRMFLKDQGIKFKPAKKKKGMIVGFVTFESAGQAKTAVECYRSWMGNPLEITEL